MSTVKHKDLTGADLHELKGVDAASANTVPVASGAGTSSWSKIGILNVNTASIKNANVQMLQGASGYQPIGQAKTLVKVTGVTAADFVSAGTDVIAFQKNGSTFLTLNITQAAGFSASAAISVAFLTTDIFRIIAPASGNTCTFYLEFTL